MPVPGGPDAEDDVVVADRLDVALLREPLRRDDAVARGDEDGVAEDLAERHALAGELRRLVHVLEVERVALRDEVVELLHEPLGEPELRLVGGGDDDLPAAEPELDPEPLLDELQVLVVRAAEGAHLVVVRELEPCRLEGFRRALTQEASF